MKTLNIFFSSITNVLFSAYGIVEQKQYVHGIEAVLRVQLAVNGIPVANGLYDFIADTTKPHYGQATLNLNQGDIVTLVNASPFPIDILPLSAGAVASSLKLTKFN